LSRGFLPENKQRAIKLGPNRNLMCRVESNLSN